MTVSLTEWTWLAEIRKPQGRKGEVYASLLTDFPEKFAERKHLWLIAETESASAQTPRQISLVSHWLHKDGVVLHFEGIDSITAAEKICHLVVAIPKADRTPLGPDEIYIGDLAGCTLIDVTPLTPEEVGVVEGVDRNSCPVPLLVVHSDDGGEILVPFAKSFIRKIDLEARRLEMALPEGLRDLNR